MNEELKNALDALLNMPLKKRSTTDYQAVGEEENPQGLSQIEKRKIVHETILILENGLKKNALDRAISDAVTLLIFSGIEDE